MEHPQFLYVVQNRWNVPTNQNDAAKVITTKFQNLRRVLKVWRSTVSNLSTAISNIKCINEFLDILEELRDLAIHEWNFRELLNQQLISLLHQQKIYRQQRGKIKRVKFGDGNTKFFIANATIKFNKNSITSMEDSEGIQHFSHDSKAQLLQNSYKDRLGTFEFNNIMFDLSDFIDA